MSAVPVASASFSADNKLSAPVESRSWSARLALAFERRGARSVLSKREQLGPLTLQKPFYPEGDDVCHCVMLHPPGGIVGGDVLALDFRVGTGARALITTPGAAKWYRSAEIAATQRIVINVAAGACCEWLPQENIFFSGAHVASEVSLSLSGDALAFGWDINCLGRRAAEERFDKGMLRLAAKIEHNTRLIWLERARLTGDDALMSSSIGLRGYSVFATAYMAGYDCDTALLDCLREVTKPHDAEVGITALPRLLVARYLGDSAEHARRYFVDVWRLLRVAMLNKPACLPRIWNT